MTILSRIDILERILEGENRIYDGDKDKLSVINEIKGILPKLKLEENFKREKPKIESNFRKLYSDLGEDKRINNILENIQNLSKNIDIDEKKRMSKKNKLPIFIDNFNFSNLQAANYDLRLGREVFTTADEYPKNLGQGNIGETVKIAPGEFGVFLTREKIYLPDDLLGLISLKSKYKMKGLVNVSGFHVDPGYYGKILFSMYNAGPNDIFLRYNEPVFMIMFDRLKKPVLQGYDASKGFDQGYRNIPVDIVSSLKGAPVSLKDLDKRVSSLEYQRNIYGGILVGLVVIVLGYLIEKMGLFK